LIAEKFNKLKNDASDWLDIWQSVADEFTIMPIAITRMRLSEKRCHATS
jgi:hypothetical protein